MVDVLTPAQRRLNMSRIRGKDTKPEMLLRRRLHALGFRFRLHRKDLPGQPDLVFSAQRAVIFVHGCFWHGHSCPLYRTPDTRREFWAAKIAGNRSRDKAAASQLILMGWRVLVVWECSVRGTARLPEGEVIGKCVEFVNSDHILTGSLTGAWTS
jgi:DNA mismatch endonuclease (patch repair protein)